MHRCTGNRSLQLSLIARSSLSSDLSDNSIGAEAVDPGCSCVRCALDGRASIRLWSDGACGQECEQDEGENRVRPAVAQDAVGIDDVAQSMCKDPCSGFIPPRIQERRSEQWETTTSLVEAMGRTGSWLCVAAARVGGQSKCDGSAIGL